jgi:hypothetical protein
MLLNVFVKQAIRYIQMKFVTSNSASGLFKPFEGLGLIKAKARNIANKINSHPHFTY